MGLRWRHPATDAVDLLEMEIGDVAHISEVDLPSGARTTIDREFVIANVSAPTVLLADEDEVEEGEDGEEVEGEEGAEGEGDDAESSDE